MSKFKEREIMNEDLNNVVLFRPHIPKNAQQYVNEVLNSRWIGQGPRVDYFENEFNLKFGGDEFKSISTNSGTSALHLAYQLAGINKGDTVLSPVLTCTATNIPLLYLGAKIKWIDVEQNSLNLDFNHLKKNIDESVKAIVVVHYGGIPVNMSLIREIADDFKIPIIQDAAHALGAKVLNKPISNFGDFTVYSFQAIKHITTGDGGMLTMKNIPDKVKLAERLRWFGINRKDKQKGTWENDISEIGYKYQMTDISAALGLAGLSEFDEIKNIRNILFNRYASNLKENKNVCVLHSDPENKYSESSYWLFSILVRSNRDKLISYLRDHGVESGLVHYRNDQYSIFNEFKSLLPNMDRIENQYLSLPLHTRMSTADVDRICDLINEQDWNLD